MTNDDNDFETEYAGYLTSDQPIDDAWKTRCHKAVDMAIKLEARIERGEALLAELRGQLRNLTDNVLPGLLLEVGQDKARLEGGIGLELKAKLECSIAADKNPKREQALQWLDDHGHGAIIKTDVMVRLDPEPDKKARQADGVVAAVTALFPGLSVKFRREAHGGQVAALLGQLYADGEVFPMELFNAHPRKTVKITRPKSTTEL